jgi:hypothetical protein
MVFTRHLPVIAALVVALGGASVAKTSFSSVWAAPEAAGAAFGGQKVAALLIDTDQSLRVSAEEALARELTARGVQGVAAYRLVPRELIFNTDEAKGWFNQAGVQGVVAMRVVNDNTRHDYQPATWSSPSYSTLWGYYGYGWGVVYDPGYRRSTRTISVETLIFSVPTNTLLWAGLSTSDNPANAQAVVGDTVKEAANEMARQGLAKTAKR